VQCCGEQRTLSLSHNMTDAEIEIKLRDIRRAIADCRRCSPARTAAHA
jgi:hypothetical protein